MTPRARFGIAAAVVVVAIAGLIGFSLAGATAYYRTTGELLAGSYNHNQRIRVAGIVVDNSIQRTGSTTAFTIVDNKVTLPVTTVAVVPDTFKAGVTVVVEGAMSANGVFTATDVLAKCPSKFSAKVAA